MSVKSKESVEGYKFFFYVAKAISTTVYDNKVAKNKDKFYTKLYKKKL